MRPFPKKYCVSSGKSWLSGSQSLLRLAVGAPEPRFKFADGVAERRLRDAELSCRLGEAALAPDRQERHQVV